MEQQELVRELGEVQHQRAIYGTDYLIPFMEPSKLRQLQELFQQANDSITAQRFIEICAQFLHFPRKEKEEFIHGLMQFFKNIDMDGSETLSWSEFTQFLIDNFDQAKQQLAEGRASDIVNRVHNHQDKRYVKSWNRQDQQSRGNGVEKVQCDKRMRLHVLERKSPRLKILTDSEPQRAVCVLPEKVYIVTFCWSQAEGKHCLIGSDLSFYFVDAATQTPLLCSFYYDILQNRVWYGQQLGCWISTGSDGRIRLWKFSKYNQEEIQQNLTLQTSIHRTDMTRKRVLQGHTDVVTCVLQLRQPRCLASCGQDGRILLWDLDTLRVLSEFKHNDLHPRSLRGLDYNPSYQHLLLSYGFEQNVKLWCPDHSMSRPYVRPLQGHYNSVLLAKFVPQTRYCLTIDQKNCMRVWDLQQYSLVQLISCERAPLNDMCFLDQDVFVLASKRLLFYDNVQNRGVKRQLDQEVYACDLLYSDFFDVLLVFSKVDTRFYDGRTGSLRMVNSDINWQTRSKELICDSKKLLAVVDNRLEQFNLKHFTRIDGCQPYDKHEMEEKCLQDTVLLGVDEFSLLLVGDSHSRITYNHFSCDGKVQLKMLAGGHRNSSITQLYRHDNVLLSGSRNGIVTLWEFCTGRYLDHFELDCEAEMLSYCRHANLAVVRGVNALKIVGKKILRLSGFHCAETDEEGNFYVSDAKGNICLYKLDDVIEAVGQLDLQLELIDRKVFNRREQLDCEKSLKDIKVKNIVDAPRFRNVFPAHKCKVTVLRWVPNQGGLVTASLDKTIKVWRVRDGVLVLQSTLNLVCEQQTKWVFPRQIIIKEIRQIQKSLKFQEQTEGTIIEDEEKIAITRRLLRKIFKNEETIQRKQNNLMEPNSTDYQPPRKSSDLMDSLTITRELGRIKKEIEVTEKKRQIRSKVERLTRSRNIVAEEMLNTAIEKNKSVAESRTLVTEASRPNICTPDASCVGTGQLSKTKARTLKRTVKSAHKVGRSDVSMKVYIDEPTTFDKQTESIRRTYERMLQRPYTGSVTRPTTAQTVCRTLIRDVKCQHNSSWKKLVRYDSAVSKWTALSRLL